MAKFQLFKDYTPKGDQPKAIEKLTAGFNDSKYQTLLGVTGSGKTFTVANVIENLQVPTLVLSHNKTLATQLYNEFQTFFPNNKICYFVSYYDYYQPESYLPPSDTYIEKDIAINEKIEQLRLEAATALLSRSDVIVIASVSCIYGFGRPEEFEGETFKLVNGQALNRNDLLKALVAIQYERNDVELSPGKFRAKGDTVDVYPVSANSNMIRVEFFGDEIEAISELNPMTGVVLSQLDKIFIYPATPFVVPRDRIPSAIKSIQAELQQRLPQLGTVESYRLNQRTNYDIEMIEQLGYCKGIENYSRHFDNRQAGEPPFTLLDFFKYAYGNDWLFVVDESHQTISQVHGMYNGDYARKKNLIDYGFRLPSAFDNRPLKFEEFEKYLNHTIFVSATPADYELQLSKGHIVEQIIRPTGLIDPPIEIKPTNHQVLDLIEEIQVTTKKGYRTLVTTLTKRMAEDLTQYLEEKDIKAVYLHSEIDTMERAEIIKQLRLGRHDVLIGINLLREGLDIPEVALVAILDADTQGFLRNERSLIQTIGRAARNSESRVIMYANHETDGIKGAVFETERRRKIQQEYNIKHGITPQTIVKAIAQEQVVIEAGESKEEFDIDSLILDFEQQMKIAAEELDFETAIQLRDKLEKLKQKIKK